MFKVKYVHVDYIMMLVRLDLNLIVSLFQHKCEVSETVSTTTLIYTDIKHTELHTDSQNCVHTCTCILGQLIDTLLYFRHTIIHVHEIHVLLTPYS